MLLIVTPENLKAVLGIAEKWGVLATDIGEVTDDGRLVISWHGEIVVDVPPGSLAEDGPVYARRCASPPTCRCSMPTGPRRCPGRARPTTCARRCSR